MGMAKDLLAKQLSHFIKGASAEQFKLRHVLSGRIELGPGVTLVEDAVHQALIDAGLPPTWEVLRAHLDTLSIHIPWANLRASSTRLIIGELELKILLHRPRDLEDILYGLGGDVTDAVTTFLEKQKERLVAAVANEMINSAKSEVPQPRSLISVVQNGLRLSVRKIRLELFLSEKGDDGGSVHAPLAELVVDGLLATPCTASGRATTQLREAAGAAQRGPDMPNLPSPLKLWVNRLMHRIDSISLRMPTKTSTGINWRNVASLNGLVSRTSLLEAFLEARGGYPDRFMPGGIGLISIHREVDLMTLRSENAADIGSLSVDVDITEADILQLNLLAVEDQAVAQILSRWKKEQRSAPVDAKKPPPSPKTCTVAEVENLLSKIDSDEHEKPNHLDVEELRGSMEDLLKTGQRMSMEFRRRSSRSPERRWQSFFGPTRNSVSFPGAGPSKPLKGLRQSVWSFACFSQPPEEEVLRSGWLLKRGALRSFLESWQERWCSLSRNLEDGSAMLRYFAARSGSVFARSVTDSFGGGHGGKKLMLRGEILISARGQTSAATFEDVRRGSVILDVLDSEKALFSSILNEFQNGFALRTRDRTFFFVHEDAQEAREWVDSIQTALVEQISTTEMSSLADFLDDDDLPPLPLPRFSIDSSMTGDLEVIQQTEQDESDADSFLSIVEEDENEDFYDDTKVLPAVIPSTSTLPLAALLADVLYIEKVLIRCPACRVNLTIREATLEGKTLESSVPLSFRITGAEVIPLFKRSLSAKEAYALSSLLGLPSSNPSHDVVKPTVLAEVRLVAASLSAFRRDRNSLVLGVRSRPDRSPVNLLFRTLAEKDKDPKAHLQLTGLGWQARFDENCIGALVKLPQNLESSAKLVMEELRTLPKASTGPPPQPTIALNFEDGELELPLPLVPGGGLKLRLHGLLEASSLAAAFDSALFSRST